jgi:hypothetical protein
VTPAFLIPANVRPRQSRGARRSVAAVIALTMLFGAGGVVPSGAQTAILGYLENVRLMPGDFGVRAKLDTGADVTSLHALDIRYIDRQGEKWVRFTVEAPDGRTATFERKLVRTMRIKRHGGGTEQRPVVRLAFCVAAQTIEAEVNLIDRTGFNEPMLIGRNAMPNGIAIDPHRIETAPPTCAAK